MSERYEPNEAELKNSDNRLDHQDTDLDKTAGVQVSTQTSVNWACWNGEPFDGRETRSDAPKNDEDDGA